jgi:hypothetical protein
MRRRARFALSSEDEGGSMYKVIRLGWIALALGLLAGCDVQIRDTTPAQYQANYDLGMYDVSATAQTGALVGPGTLMLFALGDNQKLSMAQNPDGSWHAMYSVRCASSFPLQFMAVWRLQGLTAREKLVPPQPLQVKLTEPPLTSVAVFDTAGRPPGREGWPGTVQYRFSTVPLAQITAATIQPSSSDPADVAAARGIAVATPLPVEAACGQPAEVRLLSKEPRAHGMLVIDTNDPGVPHWQTRVEFSPK